MCQIVSRFAQVEFLQNGACIKVTTLVSNRCFVFFHCNRQLLQSDCKSSSLSLMNSPALYFLKKSHCKEVFFCQPSETITRAMKLLSCL